jgi:NAD(P)-dependent dehydrogenase (short-subunit alcohol dehydrogenase family)
MKLLVTGGSGRVGAATVARLVAGGNVVTVVGRRGGLEVPGASYRACDITAEESIREATQGCEAIVHLAAIPAPTSGTAPEVFRVNASGTFNVYAAAEAAGIARVVTASSINALGYNYGRRPFPIERLPVDESHPRFTTDAYSFSKEVTEEIAAYFHRRAGISSVCLRFPWVAPESQTSETAVRERWQACRAAYDRVMGMSGDGRRAWIANLAARWEELRADGALEDSEGRRRTELMLQDPLFAGRSDFWTLLDERDAAQAVERSLLARVEGSHALYANDDHNWTGLPSQEIAALYHPGALCADVPGTSSLVSIEAVRRLIGFDPEFSVERWRRE